MKHLPINFFLLVFCIFSGCKKTQDTIWVYYDETYCSDPWGDIGTSDAERKEGIAKYLQGEGINIFRIEITNEGNEQFCYACHCTTGKFIKCEISEEDISEIKALGFYR